MKLLVVSSFYKPSVGGVEVYTHELFSRYVKKNDVEITIISLNTHRVNRHEVYKNIQIFRIDAFKLIATNPLFNPFELISILKQINARDYDLVITQARYYFLTLFFAFYCKIFKLKRVHIEHNAGYMRSSNLLVEYGARMYDNLLSKFVLLSANGLIYVSQSVKSFCEKTFQVSQNTKSAVIHAGVDCSFWQRKRKKTDLNIVSLLYVGRIVKAKGILNLVKSMSTMSEFVHLNIIGEGEEIDTVKKLSSEIHKSKNIHLLGVMTGDEILKIMHESDVYINPSQYSEGLQISLLEAASFGLPIISTDIPGVADLLENNSDGIIIPDNSPETISNAVRCLLNNASLAQKLGEKSRQKVERYFSWENTIWQFDKFIKSI